MSFTLLCSLAASTILFRCLPAAFLQLFPHLRRITWKSTSPLDELFDIRAPHIHLVKIEGDSMNGAGQFTGDLVVVDRGCEARHGDFVIAVLNGQRCESDCTTRVVS